MLGVEGWVTAAAEVSQQVTGVMMKAGMVAEGAAAQRRTMVSGAAAERRVASGEVRGWQCRIVDRDGQLVRYVVNGLRDFVMFLLTERHQSQMMRLRSYETIGQTIGQ